MAPPGSTCCQTRWAACANLPAAGGLADAGGNVTLAQAYQPYGSLLERAGSGTSTFGYAGEQEDTSGLIYLRARYMQPGLGVFLSRDMWAGDERHPATLHGFLYVEGNPINFADPSGLFSDIPFSLFTECCYNSAPTPEARLQQIIEETNHNGAEALFKAFEDKCLLDKFGRVAGQTCGERLAWLLNTTRSSWTLPSHSSIWFGNDSGFAEEFRDDQFYNGEIWWKKPQNDQVGHFLTAVDMFFYGYPLASEAAIGHELLADPGPGLWPPPGWRFGEQVRATQQWHLDAWSRALDYDKIDDVENRDFELWGILGFNPDKVKTRGDVDVNREGNSLQDLRLSLKGSRFAEFVASYTGQPPKKAAAWLRWHLAHQASPPSLRSHGR